MHTIIIIGTNPPCPRCGLLTKVIKAKTAALKINAKVEHWAYTDKNAMEFAKTLGLQTGTAKDVAPKLGKTITQEQFNSLVKNDSNNRNIEYDEYNDCNWSFELDEILRTYETQSKDVGILMTPALIINNKLIHYGSVPEMAKIDQWLNELN